MELIHKENLILGEGVFSRSEIEQRMAEGGFNSLSKFELFIWDMEMFLQIQQKLGDKIILKGGAATQFYIPLPSQRTSIDIDMICLSSQDEVRQAISEIEAAFAGKDDYCKFRIHVPKNPKVRLDALVTYYQTVPSICDNKELFATNGKQEVKIEFIYSDEAYEIKKIRPTNLFALSTDNEFNVLDFASLFADKLTTLGPTTIGIHDDRADEQVKQIYDVITLFISNLDEVLQSRDKIKLNYEKAALRECIMHDIPYDSDLIFKDMMLLIQRLKNIEHDPSFQQRANDFQALYLRKSANRDKAQWAIVGYQLELLMGYIFSDMKEIFFFRDIEHHLELLKFEHIRGPERGTKIKEVREQLIKSFGKTAGLSDDIFNKRLDRILWELVSLVGSERILQVISTLV